MRLVLFGLFGFLSVGLAVSVPSEAGLISSVTSSNNSVATVAVSQLPTLGNGRTLDLTVTLLQRNTPFELIFNSPSGAPNNNIYTVNMTVVNQTTGGANGYINGFDLIGLVGPSTVTPGWSGLLMTNTPVSPDLTLQMVNGNNAYNIAGGFRFGGLNGGGKALYNGDSALVSFRYQQKNPITVGSNGFSKLLMVANPEPGTILLGLMALAPATYALRRRKQNVAKAT